MEPYCAKCGELGHYAARCPVVEEESKRPGVPEKKVEKVEVVSAAAARKRLWRKKNRERYNEYQRELMARKRAEERG